MDMTDVKLRDVKYVAKITGMSDEEWWDHIKDQSTITQVLGCYGWVGDEEAVPSPRDDKAKKKCNAEPEYIRKRRMIKLVARERQNIATLVEERKPMRVSKKQERRLYAQKRASERQTRSQSKNSEWEYKDNLSMALLEEEMKKREEKRVRDLEMQKELFLFNSSVELNSMMIQSKKEKGDKFKVKFYEASGQERQEALEKHLAEVEAQKSEWKKLTKELQAKWKWEKVKFSGEVVSEPCNTRVGKSKVATRNDEQVKPRQCSKPVVEGRSARKRGRRGDLKIKEANIEQEKESPHVVSASEATSVLEHGSDDGLANIRQLYAEKRQRKQVMKQRLEKLRDKRVAQLLELLSAEAQENADQAAFGLVLDSSEPDVAQGIKCEQNELCHITEEDIEYEVCLNILTCGDDDKDLVKIAEYLKLMAEE